MDLLELARTLIRLPSVSPEDHGCQRTIGALLAQAGFEVEPMRFGEVDNLWARHGRERPTLCFAGHTDVVPPGPPADWDVDPFAAAVVGGKLVARGAADMKGSLAAMLKAGERFVRTHPEHRGTLAFLITSDEEGAADDGTVKVMERLAARDERLDYCVVGEPSSAAALGDTVRVGRRGSLSGILTLRGAQGHVAYPLKAPNPMHALARFIEAMTSEPLDRGNAHFPPSSFQMVYVHCDAGAPNVVPGELKCRFNVRYSTEWTHETLAAHIERELVQLGLEYEIVWRDAGRPFLTGAGELTRAVSGAVEEETGLDPELSTSGGTSDGRFIAPHGVEVVELGPLNATIHRVNEEVAIADLAALERIYFRIAARLLL